MCDLNKDDKHMFCSPLPQKKTVGIKITDKRKKKSLSHVGHRAFAVNTTNRIFDKNIG
jgi:hypothetical protein